MIYPNSEKHWIPDLVSFLIPALCSSIFANLALSGRGSLIPRCPDDMEEVDKILIHSLRLSGTLLVRLSPAAQTMAVAEEKEMLWPVCSLVLCLSSKQAVAEVIVVGDSLLRGTEAVVCCPNLNTGEVCCLPSARIQHVKDRVECLFALGGHQPLLVFHVGTNDVARQGVIGITRDFETLGKKLLELKAQVAFLLILLDRGFQPRRDRRVSEVNDWVSVWCQKEHFGFLDHSTQFVASGLLARDGLHLTRMGKTSFGDALASFVWKTLN
ncbi:Platelet-activating factor acetylhydrolase IB subunit gamma [Varanus komodoensis]|nr:Platelet-activating factor acetylhydrolase IB subunit gamma [Varanus komodoensis]